MTDEMSPTGLSLKDLHVFKEMGYVFGKQIGSGSYAKVFLVEQKTAKNRYASKIINMREAPKEYTKKFLPRELDILSKVRHPSIIYIQGIFHRGGRILIFMQYAQGGDMLEYILREQDITENKAKHWSYQILTALQYLHKLRIAHRDIKCENVLITKNMNAKLGDFGFAKVVPSNAKLAFSKTFCGSMAYVAPEVLRGKPYEPTVSDIWSLGVLVYVLLNKSLPFPHEKIPPKAIYKMQKTRQWKFRSKAKEKLSAEAKNIVAEMLEPEAAKRPKADSLVSSDWFLIDENGGKSKMELSPDEKQALLEADLQCLSVEQPILDTNKFDLLPNKMEPYSSEEHLKKQVWEPLVELPELDSNALGRVTEVLNLKTSDKTFTENVAAVHETNILAQTSTH